MELTYPQLIDGKEVKLLLVLFKTENESIWTVGNTKFTAPFCSMNTGNTNRKVSDLIPFQDKLMIETPLIFSNYSRKQKSVVLTKLGVQKMCNRYHYCQPAYVDWIRSTVLPLLTCQSSY